MDSGGTLSLPCKSMNPVPQAHTCCYSSPVGNIGSRALECCAWQCSGLACVKPKFRPSTQNGIQRKNYVVQARVKALLIHG